MNVHVTPPHFELTRVNSDGTSEPPTIVPLGQGVTEDIPTGRRGFLRAGVTISAALAAMGAGCGSPRAGRANARAFLGRATGVAHSGPIRAVAFNPQDRILVSGSDDEIIKVWSLPRGTLSGQFAKCGGPVRCLAFAGAILDTFYAGTDAGLFRAKTTENRLRTEVNGVPGPIFALAGRPDWDLVAAATGDGSIALYDSGKSTAAKSAERHSAPARAISVSQSGRQLASLGDDNHLGLWRISRGVALRASFVPSVETRAIALSPDGKWIASGGQDGTVRLRRAGARTPPKVLQGHTGGVNALKFGPDGTWLASASTDKTIRLWDVRSATSLKVLEGHGGAVNTLDIANDGRWMASGGDDMMIWIWKVPDGAPLGVLADPALNIDLGKETSAVRGSTYKTTTTSGQEITFTMPCGSPIPPGAVCVCNCVPGRYSPPTTTAPTRSVPTTRTYCSCNKVCTCNLVCTCQAVPSDRNSKENVTPFEGSILARLARVPIRVWNYRQDPRQARHIGCMAQDFSAAFELGSDNRVIQVVDAIGVAYGAIQELHQLVSDQKREIERLRKELRTNASKALAPEKSVPSDRRRSARMKPRTPSRIGKSSRKVVPEEGIEPPTKGL